MKNKTLKQKAIESLNRRAGQYERHEKGGIADICKGAAEKLKKSTRRTKCLFV